MYIIYRQKQLSSYKILISYLILVLASILVLFYYDISNLLKIFVVIILLLNCSMIFFFSRIEFRITSDGLELGFRFFKIKIKQSEVQSVSIEDSQDLYKGLGIKRNKDGVLCFVGKASEGILINTKFKESFFVSLNNSKEALENLIKNHYV